jgi:hypothetical protein
MSLVFRWEIIENRPSVGVHPEFVVAMCGFHRLTNPLNAVLSVSHDEVK